MDHYRIQRDIQSGKIAPIYVLMGEEPYFVDSITDFIEEEVLDEAEKAFNQTIVYGRDVEMHQVISTAKGYPMMGDRQVLIVKEAQDMKEWKKSEELAPLEAYVKQPQPSTMLVFAFKNKKLDMRLKVAKQMAKIAVVFESKKIDDKRLPDWINNYVKDSGHQIHPKACQLLAEYLGSDLSKLANAVNKLIIVVPKDKSIDLADIEKNVGISKDFNIFELQDALAAKDIVKSNQIIQYFEANPKANPIQMVLPFLYSFFSRLRIHQEVSQVKQEGGGKTWTPPAMNTASKRYTTDKVERIIGYLRDCDRKSKGVGNTGTTNGFLMKEMVYKILH